MHAYYYDDVPGDQRLPHTTPHALTPTHLSTLGLLYQHCPTLTSVDAIASARDYKNRDEITVSPQKMGAVYEEKVKGFFSEHMHEDEEIRWVLDGAGYFDVREDRDGEERWVRVRLEKGDLLVLPAGIYHRFTTDEGNYIRAMRLFKDEPKWTPLNRGEETERNKCRREYVEMRAQAVG